MKLKDIDWRYFVVSVFCFVFAIWILTSCGWSIKPHNWAQDKELQAVEAKQRSIQWEPIPAPVKSCKKTNTIFLYGAPACEDQ